MLPRQAQEALETLRRFPATERLLIARMLIDSVLVDAHDDEIDWQQLGLASFEKDWDNEEDAIYDTFRQIS